MKAVQSKGKGGSLTGGDFQILNFPMCPSCLSHAPDFWQSLSNVTAYSSQNKDEMFTHVQPAEHEAAKDTGGRQGSWTQGFMKASTGSVRSEYWSLIARLCTLSFFLELKFKREMIVMGTL